MTASQIFISRVISLYPIPRFNSQHQVRNRSQNSKVWHSSSHYSSWRATLLASRAGKVCSPRRAQLLTSRAIGFYSPSASDLKTGTGSTSSHSKLSILSMFNLKTYWNLSTILVPGSVINSYSLYITYSLIHHFNLVLNSLKNSSISC